MAHSKLLLQSEFCFNYSPCWPRFADRRKKIAAVFCDDWKDDDKELPSGSLSNLRNAVAVPYPQSCQFLSLDIRYNTVPNTIKYSTSTWFASNHPRKRQFVRNCYFLRKRYSLGTTINSRQDSVKFKSEDSPSLSSTNIHENLKDISPTISFKSNVGESKLEQATSNESVSHLPLAALPGLSMAINMATITQAERDLFLELTPRGLEDPRALTNLVAMERDKMMNDVRPKSQRGWDGWDNKRDGYDQDEDFKLDAVQEMRYKLDFEDFIDY